MKGLTFEDVFVGSILAFSVGVVTWKLTPFLPEILRALVATFSMLPAMTLIARIYEPIKATIGRVYWMAQSPPEPGTAQTGRNIRHVMRSHGLIEEPSSIDASTFETWWKMYADRDERKAITNGKYYRETEEHANQAYDYIQRRSELRETVEQAVRDDMRSIEVAYRWANCPPAGEATPEDPAILLIEKHPKLPRRKIQKREFWGAIQGAKRKLKIKEDWENDDKFRALYLSDETTSLPDQINLDIDEAKSKTENLDVDEFMVGLNEQEKWSRIKGLQDYPHILLIGAPGSGKSVLLNWILWQGAERGMKLSMIDPDTDLSDDVRRAYESRGNLLNYTIEPEAGEEAKESDDDPQTTTGYKEHIERLEQRLRDRQTGAEDPHPTFVVFEEYSDSIEPYKMNQQIMDALVNRGREPALQVITVFQSPSKDRIGDVRESFSWHLAGDVQGQERTLANLYGSKMSDQIEDAVNQCSQIGRFMLYDREESELEIVQTPYNQIFETRGESADWDSMLS